MCCASADTCTLICNCCAGGSVHACDRTTALSTLVMAIAHDPVLRTDTKTKRQPPGAAKIPETAALRTHHVIPDTEFRVSVHDKDHRYRSRLWSTFRGSYVTNQSICSVALWESSSRFYYRLSRAIPRRWSKMSQAVAQCHVQTCSR